MNPPPMINLDDDFFEYPDALRLKIKDIIREQIDLYFYKTLDPLFQKIENELKAVTQTSQINQQDFLHVIEEWEKELDKDNPTHALFFELSQKFAVLEKSVNHIEMLFNEIKKSQDRKHTNSKTTNKKQTGGEK